MKAFLIVCFLGSAIIAKGETYLEEVGDFNDDDTDNDIIYSDLYSINQICKDDYTKCVNDASWVAKIGGYKKCKFHVLYNCCNGLNVRCNANAANPSAFLKCKDELAACKIVPTK